MIAALPKHALQRAGKSLVPPRPPTNFLVSALTKPWQGEENPMTLGPVGARRSQFGSRKPDMGSVSGSLVLIGGIMKTIPWATLTANGNYAGSA